MSAVDELVTWLRAQLDEDERVLRELDDVQHYPYAILWRSADRESPAVLSIEVNGVKAYRRYWDPEHSGEPNDWGWNAKDGVALFSTEMVAERLAEVEAKRRILAQYEEAQEAMGHYSPEGHSVSWLKTGTRDALREAVRILAQPYAGREGWREEWVA